MLVFGRKRPVAQVLLLGIILIGTYPHEVRGGSLPPCKTRKFSLPCRGAGVCRSLARYAFHRSGLVHGQIDEVYTILVNFLDYPCWTPSFPRVDLVRPGDEFGLGARYHAVLKGRLPYRLRVTLTVVEVAPPYRLVAEVTGDLRGRGVYTLERVGTQVRVRYDYSVEVQRPLLRYLSPVLRPVFQLNHRSASDASLRGLRREVARRRR